jgi:hypothetical protein
VPDGLGQHPSASLAWAIIRFSISFPTKSFNTRPDNSKKDKKKASKKDGKRKEDQCYICTTLQWVYRPHKNSTPDKELVLTKLLP